MIIPFGEWAPDAYTPNSNIHDGYLVSATNAIPLPGGYAHMEGPSTTNPDLVSINDIVARPQGVFDGRRGGASTLFIGDVSRLYRLTSFGGSLSDISAATYATEQADWWDFTQFGEVVIATNNAKSTVSGGTQPQRFQLGVSSAFTTISSGFHAKRVATVRDFVVFGNTWDATDGVVENRVRWSGFGDETSYGINPTTQSDIQDLVTGGGPIQKIIGGRDAYIFQQRAITRMSYEGPPTVFRFDTLSEELGTSSPMSVIEYGGVVYFYSQDGFKAISSEGIQSIGANKVDRFFATSLLPGPGDGSEKYLTAAIDKYNNSILWAFGGSDSSPNSGRYGVRFSIPTGKWSFIDSGSSHFLLPFGTELDATYKNRIYAFTTSRVIEQYSPRSDTLGGLITTGEYEFHDGARGIITEIGVAGRFDDRLSASEKAITVYSRDNPGREISSGDNGAAITSAFTKNQRTGNYVGRASGRYQRVELSWAANEYVRNASGAEIFGMRKLGRY